MGSHSLGQNLIKSGSLEDLIFEFKGTEQYHLKSNLTHALAYVYSKEVSDVYAKITYKIDYEVFKIPGKGFETMITFHPGQKNGFYELYKFDFSKEIFPLLRSIDLYYTKGSEYIYVKPILLLDSLKDVYYFKFKHQRFSDDWQLSLRNLQWQENYNEKEFDKRWALVNDYQLTQFWLTHIEYYIKKPRNPWGNQLYHLKWLNIFDQIKNLEFYQKLILIDHEDPLFIEEKINIVRFILERNLEGFSKLKENENIVLEELFQDYFALEHDLISLSEMSNDLYGDLYFEFDPLNREYFCLEETHKILQESQIDSAMYFFERSIQEQSIQLISRLIEEKKAKEALFQIKRFNQFYKLSYHLTNAGTFSQFKAQAVYDIYLSYIQVSRQALEYNQIEMAITYLDKASEVQKQYPSEIINNLQVEKQVQELVKKGMNRYQDLLEKEEFETAKQVKKGILGLMKKLGLNDMVLPNGRS